MFIRLGMLIVFFLVILVDAKLENFNPKRVHLIDYSSATGSFLFRGNEPVWANNMTFAYSELQIALQNASSAVGGPRVPNDIYIVDINLLEIERSSIAIEEKFFSSNPSKGVFVHR
jgi:hypothetical protein